MKIKNTMKRPIFWNITPCSPLKVNQRFGGKCRLHLQGRRISSLLATCFMLAFTWPILLPWRWRRHIPPKCPLTSKGLHGVRKSNRTENTMFTNKYNEVLRHLKNIQTDIIIRYRYERLRNRKRLSHRFTSLSVTNLAFDNKMHSKSRRVSWIATVLDSAYCLEMNYGLTHKIIRKFTSSIQIADK
jgi:hypothetical protein